MANKVYICGMDTSTLPKPTNKKIMELLIKVKKKESGAKQEFIYNNMRLVLSIVQRFNLPSNLIDDVFQVGIIGLIKSMNNFDTELGVQFSTYAVPMIIGEIKRFMRDRTSIKVTRSLRDIAYRTLKIKEEYNRKGKELTLEELAKEAECSKQNIIDAMQAIAEPVSLFDTVYQDNDGTLSLIDQLEDKCLYEENWIEGTLLNEALKKLSKRELNILGMRYFAGKTQMEISDEIGISQAQVSRLEKNALAALKETLSYEQ